MHRRETLKPLWPHPSLWCGTLHLAIVSDALRHIEAANYRVLATLLYDIYCIISPNSTRRYNTPPDPIANNISIIAIITNIEKQYKIFLFSSTSAASASTYMYKSKIFVYRPRRFSTSVTIMSQILFLVFPDNCFCLAYAFIIRWPATHSCKISFTARKRNSFDVKSEYEFSWTSSIASESLSLPSLSFVF